MQRTIIQSVNTVEVWERDENDEDYEAKIQIGENNETIGEVVVSYEKQQVYDLIGKDEITKSEIENAISIIALKDFENLKRLPRISKFSPLMQIIYDNICESDSEMCFIEEEDEFCTMEDIEKLKEEVKEFGLENYITFNEDDCLVTGYSGLVLQFIDDRGLHNENKC